MSKLGSRDKLKIYCDDSHASSSLAKDKNKVIVSSGDLLVL